MKKILTALLCAASVTASAQSMKSESPLLDEAFNLAVWTIDNNTSPQKLLAAGGNYGGEWTRDISINSWNAASQLRPDVARYSLWSVIENNYRIGHQYWDKIIWVIGAWNHYLVTGDEQWLKDSYRVSKVTMEQLEDSVFDARYGLFTGPAVFQDGIAAYDEPIYDPQRDSLSYVLDHPNSHAIKCLSTNSTYYQAYVTLAKMAKQLEPAAAKAYQKKAATLRKQIRKHLYNAKANKLYYLIDHTGARHDYREGLGVAYAIMFGVVNEKEAQRIIASIHDELNVDAGFHAANHSYGKGTPRGIPTVFPCFARNSEDKPGRHNVMVWPHVNMFYASACAQSDKMADFWFEVNNLADLAINADNHNFHEIYTVDGTPSGGWQCSKVWPPLNHQTWCATGFLRTFLYDVFGMKPDVEGLSFAPKGMENGSTATLNNIRYRNAVLNITIKGNGQGKMKSFTLDGQQTKPFLPADITGKHQITIEL